MKDGRQRACWRSLTLLAALALPALARPAHAQDGFLFGPPRVGLTLRGGVANAQARSDLFDFTTTQLTLDRHDFTGLSLGADLSIATASPRLHVVLGSGYASSSAGSDYREFFDQDEKPILQTTSFKRVPLTVGMKAYPFATGHRIGSLAWVPARFAPYVGAGVGATWYRFRQEGSFVDFNDANAVFDDTFQTSGWGPTGYGGAGIDFSVSPHVAVTADARYLYAKASVGDDFSGFNRIDLSGLSTTVGITFRF